MRLEDYSSRWPHYPLGQLVRSLLPAHAGSLEHPASCFPEQDRWTWQGQGDPPTSPLPLRGPTLLLPEVWGQLGGQSDPPCPRTRNHDLGEDLQAASSLTGQDAEWLPTPPSTSTPYPREN